MKIELFRLVIDDMLKRCLLMETFEQDIIEIELAVSIKNLNKGDIFAKYGTAQQIRWYYKSIVFMADVADFCRSLIHHNYIEIVLYIHKLVSSEYVSNIILYELIKIRNDKIVMKHFNPHEYPYMLIYSSVCNTQIFEWYLSVIGVKINMCYINNIYINSKYDSAIFNKFMHMETNWWINAMEMGLNKYISDEEMKIIITYQPFWFNYVNADETFHYWNSIGLDYSDVLQRYVEYYKI